MTAAIDTAMVMAAGLGTRMRPLTNDRPKALVEVDGRALIDHMLDRLRADGVGRAVVNVHHFADRLETHLAAREQPRVVISDERDQLLETGGAMVKARAELGDAPVFVANSDSIWREDPGTTPALAALRAAFDADRMDALLLLARRDRSLGFPGAGDFAFVAEDAGPGALARRGDRPETPFAYMGVQILNPALLDGFAAEPFSLNRAWDRALPAGRVHGLVLAGEWMHVGDPAARDAAEARLAQAAA